MQSEIEITRIQDPALFDHLELSVPHQIKEVFIQQPISHLLMNILADSLF